MVYLNASKRHLSKIERVDYFFKDSWDNRERKITSFRSDLNLEHQSL